MIVVAASNSPDLYVQDADFVASGSGDQKAINDALAVGDPILAPGDYHVDGAVLMPASATLSGSKRATIHRQAGYRGAVVHVPAGADLTTVERFVVDGNKAAVSGDVHTVLVEGSGCRIEDLLVRDTPWDGIAVRGGVERVTVQGCHAVACGTPGSSGSGIRVITPPDSPARRVDIVGNYVEAPAKAGIVANVVLHAEVSGNTVVDTGPDGDGFSGYDRRNQFVTWVNNLVRNAGNHGFHVAGDRVRVSDNVVDGVRSGYGIFLADNSSGSRTDLIVADNIVYAVTGGSSGIIIERYADGSVSGNQVSNCPDATGISVVRCSRVSVGDNNVSGCGDGIRYQRSTRGAIDGNTLWGNRGHGVVLANYGQQPAVNYVVVSNNTAMDNDGFGIDLREATDYIVVVGNELLGNRSGGLRGAGAHTIYANNQTVR